MAGTVIDWDGKTVPRGLKVLPPGRYVITPAGEKGSRLSPEEDAAVREGLDDLKAGRVAPLRSLREELDALSHGG